MSNHEWTPHTSLASEQVSASYLKNAYTMIREITPIHEQITPDAQIVESFRKSSAIPFNSLDAVSVDLLPAEYDPENNDVYPETITLQAHGFYGDMDANERSLAYTLAYNPTENTYSGFVLQAFHDSESYPLEVASSLPGFARTVAAQYTEYASTIDHDQPGFSTDDFKRTAELRPLDQSDIDMIADVILQQSRQYEQL